MPLLDRNKFPPGGFPYREPSLNWSAPADGAPFNDRVRQMQAVRAANPTAALDPTFDACAAALDLYTCTRLKNDPAWCAPATDPVVRAVVKARATRPPCKTCGKRRAVQAGKVGVKVGALSTT